MYIFVLQGFSSVFAVCGPQGKSSWSLSSMHPCRLHSLACICEWHSPRGCTWRGWARMCFCVHWRIYALPSLRTHPCMRMSRNASLPDLSALGVPLKAMGWRWETDIRVARAQARARCHTPVPSGRDTGRYDVLQMDTSVCFLGNKSAKMQRGNRIGAVLEGNFICLHLL